MKGKVTFYYFYVKGSISRNDNVTGYFNVITQLIKKKLRLLAALAKVSGCKAIVLW